MRKAICLSLGLGFVLSMALSTEAQNRCRPRPGGIDRREHRQQQRIRHGVRSGELTRAETLRLQREQFAIRREERRYRSDGELTPRERAELQRELNQASRHIYRSTHNERE